MGASLVKSQDGCHGGELEARVLPGSQIARHALPVAGERLQDLVEQPPAQRIIDRPAIVGIDQTEIPELGTL